MHLHLGAFELQTMYADFGKDPPAQLLRRLQNIDARRQQVTDFFMSIVSMIQEIYLEYISSRELILFGGRMPI
jgi:hypothetical protein